MEDGIIGFFGKIPANGDFVTRQLKQEAIDKVTKWMVAFIDESKKQLGDNWLSIYLTSPVWRFAATRGCFGDFPCQGIIFPSVDKVGRYFPMMVLSVSQDSPVSVYLHNHQWYEKIEQESLLVLDDNDTLDSFITRLQALNRLNNNPQDQTSSTLNLEHGLSIALTHKGIAPTQVIASTINSLLTSKHEAHSLWWTENSDKIPPSFMLCEGIPAKRHCVAMLDGQWEASGWSHINSL